MNIVKLLFKKISDNARKKRATLFLESFMINENTTILDLGSENGSNINSILKNTKANPKNVFIADIDSKYVAKGNKLFGFQPVMIDQFKPLPFPDNFFDIVFCSSVIEHVTMGKNEVWKIYSGKVFREKSFRRQTEFANEIKRLGKQYFVQTPNKHFIVESHSWLPFVSWLPRQLLIPFLNFTNLFWVKKTNPDWNLLNRQDISNLFNDAKIKEEKILGFTKSLMVFYGSN